jgi:anti-sigma factor RsiW
MTPHDTIRELLAAVALDAATPEETGEVDTHVAGCTECAAELASLRAAAGALSLDVPQLDPPPTLKRRIMDEVRTDIAQRPQASPQRARRSWFRPWPAIAGALATLAVGLVAWNVTMQRDGDRIEEIAIAATDRAPQVSGTATYLDDGTVIMRVRGLPPLATGQRYELWTIRDGAPRSEGFAAVTADGEAVVATGNLSDAEILAITREVPTNTTAPTETPLVTIPATRS